MSKKAGTAMTIVKIRLDLTEMTENFSIGLRLNEVELGSCWMRENLKEFSDETGPRAAECCQPKRAKVPYELT